MRFLERVLLASAFFLFAALPSFAQAFPTDLSNDTGVKPWEYYDRAQETVNMESGNLNIVIPLLSLPGRNGHNLDLSLSYNSQHYTPVGSLNNGNPPQVGVSWQPEQANLANAGIAAGWQINFPTLYATGVTTPPNGDNPQIGCWQNFVLVMGDGARYTFSVAMVSCWENVYQGSIGWKDQVLTQEDRPIVADDQYQGILLDAWRGVVTFKDGSQIWFPLNNTVWADAFPSGTAMFSPSAYVDTNGNVISFSTDGNGNLTITDSVGRTVYIPNGLGQIQYHNSNGTLETIALNFVPSVFPTPTFNQPVVGGYVNSVSVNPVFEELNSIVLPNGLTYTFQYDAYGEITKITYPSGGYARYSYGVYERPVEINNDYGFEADQRTVAKKYVCRAAVTAAGATTPSGYTGASAPNTCTQSEDVTTYNFVAPGAPTYANSVTDPLGNETSYTFGNPTTTIATYQGTSTLMQNVVETQSYYHTVERDTTLFNGLTSKILWTYDMTPHTETESVTDRGVATGFSTPITSYNVTQQQEYDFTGSLVRQTNYSYIQTANPANGVDYYGLNLHILNRKSQEIVYSVSGSTLTQVALTNYTVDQYPSSVSASYATQHGYPIAAQWYGLQANANAYSTSFTTRGNTTSISRWLNSPSGYVTSYNYQFDDAGNVLQQKDPLGNLTTYSYADSWANTTCAPPGGVAYVTKITNALNQYATSTYNSCTGTLASVTDLNSQTTTLAYDAMDRRVKAVYPDGGSTCLQYSDLQNTSCPTNSGSALPISIVATQPIISGSPKTTTTILDGLSRVATTQINSDPSGGDSSGIGYDGIGQKAKVSNPYRTAGTIITSTEGNTTYTYDALHRPLVVTEPDGSTIQMKYCGNSTLVTDEAGHWRRSTTDGLGRLVEVDEPSSLTSTVNQCPSGSDQIWATTYTYDALDDLTGVSQGGSRPRTFVYDSLGRLLSSTNPETKGIAVTYAYDANGNVLTKTNARGTQINFTYDALNRELSQSATGDPTVSFTYDGTSCEGASACYNVGHRNSMTDGGGSESWAYDQMGRVIAQHRHTNNILYASSYSFNLDGSLHSINYPSGRTIAYTYDLAGRMTSAYDPVNNINYALNGVYTPAGSLAALQYSTLYNTTWIYNSRLQPCWIYTTAMPNTAVVTTPCTETASAGTILDLKYNYNAGSGDNGNVVGITNDRDTTRSQSFTYDQVNRISTAQTPSVRSVVQPSGGHRDRDRSGVTRADGELVQPNFEPSDVYLRQ
jgi:YD repeat-containing protein